MSKDKFDFLLGRKDTAEVLGVSSQTVANLDVNPKIKRGVSLMWDIREVVHARLLQLGSESDIPSTLQDHKTRLAKAQADKAELDLKERRQELVPSDSITEHWETLFVNFRAKVLAIPPKAASVAIAATSLEDVEDSIESFLIEALEELSGDGMPNEHKTNIEESKTNIKAASKTKRKPVGRQVPKAKSGVKRRTRTMENK